MYEEDDDDDEDVAVLEQREKELNAITRRELAEKISRMKEKIRKV